MAEFVTAEKAISLIKNGSTIAVSGFCGFGVPEELLIATEQRFLQSGEPKNLALMNCAGTGDGKNRGMNRLGHPGLIKKVYCGHIGLAPLLYRLAAENIIEAYIVPQGVTVHILRAIAGKKPGVITHVGLNTYADPRIEGCRGNNISQDKVVELITIGGREWLFYKTFPIDVAFIRGTTADTRGNISLEKEAVIIEQLMMAQAAKNCGGLVMAQVERVTEYPTLQAQNVKIPSLFVDYVVVAKPENHWQSFASPDYNPAWTGEIRIPFNDLEKMDLNERKVCGRRGVLELVRGCDVNLGIGVSEAVATVVGEEGLSNKVTLSIESGAIGGVPAGGLGIGASYNPDAIIDQASQFDFYDGGGIDIAYLGAAEIDQFGNVNVSKFGGKVVGPGGFINISQNAKKVVFCGTFMSGGLKVEISDGKLKIANEGSHIKFKKNVEQITFSGEFSRKVKQMVLYITERAVFMLTDEGLVLTEIAPGVDLERNILANMEFKPVISKNLKTMDQRIFSEQLMGLTL